MKHPNDRFPYILARHPKIWYKMPKWIKKRISQSYMDNHICSSCGGLINPKDLTCFCDTNGEIGNWKL